MRETHLVEVGIRLSSVVKGMSQVLHLIGSIGIGIGIRQQEQKGQKDEVDRELAKDRPHLDLFQSLSPCPGHFAIVETSGACHRGSSAERRLHLKHPPVTSLLFSSVQTNLVTMQILFVLIQSHMIVVVIDELGRLLVLLLAFRSTEQCKEDRQAHNLT